MALASSITEVPQQSSGRLPFPLLLARVVSNPVGKLGRDFYAEPMVV
jgi:hypothetical protein